MYLDGSVLHSYRGRSIRLETKIPSHLVRSRTRVLQPSNSLLDRNDIRWQLGNDPRKDRRVDRRPRIWRSLDRVVHDNVPISSRISTIVWNQNLVCYREQYEDKCDLHFVIQVEQLIRRVQDDARRPDARQDDSIDLLRAEDFLELIPKAGIVSCLDDDDIARSGIDVKGRIDLRQGIARRAQGATDFGERDRRGGCAQFGLARVGEVDAREDGQRGWSLLVHRVDPAGDVVDPLLSFWGRGEGADDAVDEVEVEHGVVRAKVEGRVARNRRRDVCWAAIVAGRGRRVLGSDQRSSCGREKIGEMHT